ncbi:MAG: oxidative damage protection protein [Gammaproteobacteria bacterium]|nr:oxidative damage protection protein [Gammaproteobacteria bacterium]
MSIHTALTSQPYPGALGARILAEISQEKWQAWLAHQTTLINEYRFNLMDISARTFLRDEMEKFLFTGGAEKPSGFIEK